MSTDVFVQDILKHGYGQAPKLKDLLEDGYGQAPKLKDLLKDRYRQAPELKTAETEANDELSSLRYETHLAHTHLCCKTINAVLHAMNMKGLDVLCVKT